MKTTIWFLVGLTVAALLGLAAGRNWPARVGVDVGPEPAARQILYWKAPMDPNYRRDAPGKSPMGMDLVPVYADDATESGLVSIDPRLINSLGVRSTAVETGPLARRVETVGYVAYDEQTLHHIHTRVEGWIERLVPRSKGERVTKGQTLFELYSPTLVNAQEEFLAAINSGSRSLREASRKRLGALGVTDGEVDRLAKTGTVRTRVRVNARDDGVVAALGVREGMFITPAFEVMSIAGLDRVWVLAEVFERQAAWVGIGQRADIEVDSFPGEHRSAKVDYIYPELDARTRTLRVRLELDNVDGALLPNMFARVTIHGDATAPMIHVPAAAVIRGGLTDRVVLDLDEGRFRSQPVRIGIESGGRVAILTGLAGDERVVVSGQFLIDSESNVASALQRYESGATDHAGGTHDGMDHGMHQSMEPAEPAMDHSTHQSMEPAKPAMDHSKHQSMQPAEPAMDHSMHESMEPAEPAMDHSMHESMEPAKPAMDHSKHQSMQPAEPAMDHSTHQSMEPAKPGTDANRDRQMEQTGQRKGHSADLATIAANQPPAGTISAAQISRSGGTEHNGKNGHVQEARGQ